MTRYAPRTGRDVACRRQSRHIAEYPREASCRAKRLRLNALAMIAATTALHATGAAAELATCAAITDDAARLACYDDLARAERTRGSPTQASPAPDTGVASTAAPAEATSASELERRWELRPDLKRGVLKVQGFRPMYALAHFTSNENEMPGSPTRALTGSDIQLQRIDAKLQLSFKSKLLENVLGSQGDVWFDYTQQSYWQAANARYSSPFRETNYEPEIMLVHPLGGALGPVHARYAALSLTHQSNGRGESLSRSWNRVIGEVALESGPWALQLRPWWRIEEPLARDDNPDIEDFVGRGELVATYRAGGHVLTLHGRHSLRSGDRSHGSAQFDWAFPLAGSLNGHVQLFSGYGENLIDYNHRQTTVGVGLSFRD